MKKSTVAILGTLVVSVLAAACSGPAPAAVRTNRGTVPEPSVSVMPVPIGPTTAPTDDERLTVVQSSVGILINDYAMHGPAIPESLFVIANQIVQARETLRQLDGQREGLAMLTAQYAASGMSAPESIFDQMSRVAAARGETLRAVGLEQ